MKKVLLVGLLLFVLGCILELGGSLRHDRGTGHTGAALGLFGIIVISGALLAGAME